MGDHRDEAERNFQGRVMKEIIDHGKETAASRIGSWMIMGNVCDSEQSDDDAESFSDGDDSEGSDVSSASSDMAEEEDVVSSSSSASSSSSLKLNGPLYELSELLAHLPPSQRSGLSKHYQGKSQSFTSLASVKSVEDLAKRANPYRKNMKRQCKYYTTPKAMISKKKKTSSSSSSSSRVSFLSSVSHARGSCFLSTSVCKSSISVQKQKNFG